MKVALVAGETSGDLLAGLLLDGLKTRWPELQSFGIGGERMMERGFAAWWSSDQLAVRGYMEVLRHYREITGIRRQLKARLLAPSGKDRPDVFIGVDAPDFNLDLAHDLRASGMKTIQFVSPSIWAWRGERIEKIQQSVDHVLCIFPFEPAIYAKHGVSASYVGHPLAGVIPLEVNRDKAREALGLFVNDVVVAVLPGSRTSEIEYLGLPFAQTIKRLLQARPALKVLIPAVPLLKNTITEQLGKVLGASECHQVQVLHGQSHAALAACDVSLVASGTATLEAALFKRPMVIAYKMHALSWWKMRRMKYQPWVGLPNILCQDFVVPEFLQNAATPEALSDAVLAWLDDPVRCAAITGRFMALHHELLRDTPRIAAGDVAKVLAQ
ncbi:MAG: lipid-A-disaccharide synthase [Cytophagales bacterium]|nr:lipid-A-disaccharide synthase [Cytophagales bacterium]